MTNELTIFIQRQPYKIEVDNPEILELLRTAFTSLYKAHPESKINPNYFSINPGPSVLYIEVHRKGKPAVGVSITGYTLIDLDYIKEGFIFPNDLTAEDKLEFQKIVMKYIWHECLNSR